jgi:ProP effector
MAKSRDFTAVQNTIAALADLYPACFAVFQERRKPLKVGVRDDVIAALNGAITDKEVSRALRWYCGNSGYLKACVEGAPRIDLNGEAVGTVTAEEADNARARLAQQHAKQRTRRQKTNGRAVSIDTASAEPKPRRLGLADLRRAAQARRAVQSA